MIYPTWFMPYIDTINPVGKLTAEMCAINFPTGCLGLTYQVKSAYSSSTSGVMT